MSKNLQRLNKFLSTSGVCSRRAADKLIEQGKVEVNGKIVSKLGTKVDPDSDLVKVGGKLLQAEEKRVYRFYKPKGVVSTLSDPYEKNTLTRFVKKLPVKVFPVGRLDKDASGLLLLTNDGDLSDRLSHPKFGVERTYIAEVKGTLHPQAIEKASDGFFLEDGFVKAKLQRRKTGGGLDLFFGKYAEGSSLVEVTIAEGRNHLVKRLLKKLGVPVINLVRLSHGEFKINSLKPGEIEEHC